MDGPRLVIQVLEKSVFGILDRPIRALINPAALRLHRRFLVGVNDDFDSELLETLREVGHEQFGSTVVCRRDRDERWRNEADSQLRPPVYFLPDNRCAAAALTLYGAQHGYTVWNRTIFFR